jgi:hypothetical protein
MLASMDWEAAIQAVARAAGQTWLISAMMTDLADLLTVLDQFLRSIHEVTALLGAVPRGTRLASQGRCHGRPRSSCRKWERAALTGRPPAPHTRRFRCLCYAGS